MTKEKVLVEIRRLPETKWHGKTGKEDFSQPKSIRALYDDSIGGYATGLTEEEAKEYGEKLGLDLSNTFNSEKAHPVWDTATGKIKLPSYPVFFDMTRPMEFVKVKVCKASKLVANSMKEWEEGLFPEATHVIYDESEQVKIKATKIQKKREAYLIINKMSTEELTNILTIISDKPIKGKSQNFIDVELEKVIDNDAAQFLMYAKMDKKELYTRATILEGIHKNILVKEGNAIYYMNDRVADTFEDAVKYFLDPQNQSLKASLLEKLT